MMFYRLIKFDIIKGSRCGVKRCVLFITVILFACVDATLQMKIIGEGQPATLGNYYAYIFGGIKPYEPKIHDFFKVPLLWLLVNGLLLYFPSKYVWEDFEGVGANIIYRSQSRLLWWLSKNIYLALNICLYSLLSWLLIFLFAFFSGTELSFTCSSYMLEIMDVGFEALPPDQWPIGLEYLATPLFTCITMGCMQLFVGLISKPTYSYIISVIVLISSAYAFHPFLIGNYAMGIRSANINPSYGFFWWNSLPCFVFIIFLSLFAGSIVFSRHNILGRE